MEAIARELARSAGWSEPRFIDAGNSASVFEVTHPDHGAVALKVYDPDFFTGDNALIEVRRVELQQELRDHGNEHLVNVIAAEEIPSEKTWYLLMEFCPWASLEKRLAAVPNEKIQDLICQLAKAVMFLDGRGLVHRDIKPANIAVSEDFSRLKLLDLGVLRRVAADEGNGTDAGEKKRFVATAQYSPPEYLPREERRGEEGFHAINAYQVGAVLHDLIMKRALFSEEASTLNRYVLYKAITSSIPRLSNPDVPARLLALCRAALDKDAGRRANGVSLQDFCNPVDTADTLRRRLASAAGPPLEERPPSCLLWDGRVAGWLRSAAIREADALGPVRVRRIGAGSPVSWSLIFPRTARAISVTMQPSEATASLSVVMSIGEPSAVSIQVLDIYNAGVGVEDEEIVAGLAEHILYLVDLASVPEDPTTPGSEDK